MDSVYNGTRTGFRSKGIWAMPYGWIRERDRWQGGRTVHAEGISHTNLRKLRMHVVLEQGEIWIAEAGALEAECYTGARLGRTVNATLGVIIPFYRKLEFLEGLTKLIWKNKKKLLK